MWSSLHPLGAPGLVALTYAGWEELCCILLHSENNCLLLYSNVKVCSTSCGLKGSVQSPNLSFASFQWQFDDRKGSSSFFNSFWTHVRRWQVLGDLCIVYLVYKDLWFFWKVFSERATEPLLCCCQFEAQMLNSSEFPQSLVAHVCQELTLCEDMVYWITLFRILPESQTFSLWWSDSVLRQEINWLDDNLPWESCCTQICI